MIANWVLGVLFPPRCAVCRLAGFALCEPCLASLRCPRAFACGSLQGVAVGAYAGPMRQAILHLKRGRRDLAEPLGALLAMRLAGEFDDGVALVPIPTTAPRRRARGFDQAQLLAQAAARRLGLSVSPLLEQTADDAQQGRSRAQRLAASGRFRARGASPLQGVRVVLVDDVATTGATLRDAAATLERAGARVRGAAVLARAQEIR